MAKKKLKCGICGYCGRHGRVTDEHVLPRMFWGPSPVNPQHLKMDACYNCNQGAKHNQEYLHSRLVLNHKTWTHPIANAGFRQLLKTLSDISKRPFCPPVLSQIKMVEIISQFGNRLHEMGIISIDEKRMRDAITLMCRGLFFIQYHRVLPETTHSVAIISDVFEEKNDQIRLLEQSQTRIRNRFISQLSIEALRTGNISWVGKPPTRALRDNIFWWSHSFVQFPEGSRALVYAICFFERIVNNVVFIIPKDCEWLPNITWPALNPK